MKVFAVNGNVRENLKRKLKALGYSEKAIEEILKWYK